MRPEILVISAWGPFRGVETVDFTKYRGIFLIAGPTGAGKTTIFDAMTFALYGQTSGSLRETAQVRSDFAPEEAKTYVDFTFSHKGEQYRVRRSPSYLRRKRRGDGYTTEREQAVLYLPDGTAEEGNVPVSRLLRELLGIDAVQFKQLSMIAQGEFMRLLIARADERREIFREIFHLGRFDRMRQAVQARERELRGELAGLRTRLLEQVRSLEGREELFAGLLNEESADWDQVEERLGRQLEQWKEQLRAEERRYEEQTRSMQRAVKALEQRERDMRLLEELAGVRRTLSEREAQRSAREAERRRVEAGKRALALGGEASVLQELRRQCAETEERLRKNEEQERLASRELRDAHPLYERMCREAEREAQRAGEAARLREILVAAEELERAEKRLADMQRAYVQLQASYEQARSHYEELDRRYRAAAVGLAARYLVEGEPCPVCGSTEHPRKAEVSEDLPDEKQLAGEKTRLDALFGRLNAHTRETAGQNGSVRELRRSFEERLRLAFGDGREALPELAAAADVREETEFEEAVPPAKLCAAVRERLAELARESEEYREKGGKIREDYEARERLLEQLRAVRGQLREALGRAEERRKEQELAFGTGLLKAGFETEQEYEDARTDERELRKREERLRSQEQELLLLQQREQQLLEETRGAVRADLSGEREALQELERQMRAEERQRRELHARIRLWGQAAGNIAGGRARQRQLEETYGKVADIARAVSGNNRQNLIFEDYVIAGYFDRMLRAANGRLRPMTRGRYELSRVPRASDLRSRDSLEVQVLDNYTGKYRAVKTLSGGESFQAALSMALGMADLIGQSAGGIGIEALFIDEGFGALDGEALDQAVETLLSLAGPGRMIGIISHVTELKERIDRQIAVEVCADGSRIRTGGYIDA